MPEEVIKECSILLNKYVRAKTEATKVKVRNEAFEIMRGYLVLWINSISKRWYKHEDKNTTLSLSWDAFEWCLKYYKLNYNVAPFFYSYTRYFLLDHYGKRENVRIPLEELQTILQQFPNPEYHHFERLLTLYQFRDVIPEDFLPVWDDALLSLDPDRKNRVSQFWRSKKVVGSATSGKGEMQHSIHAYTYNALKKSYVAIIKLILGIKENGKVDKCLKSSKQNITQ